MKLSNYHIENRATILISMSKTTRCPTVHSSENTKHSETREVFDS